MRRIPPTCGVQHDNPSFTIDVLPAEAFEALLIVTSWIGEVLVDDPPYVLEVFLHEPQPCWCRLDLVPDAGGTTISLTVAAVDDEPAPDIDEVRTPGWWASMSRFGEPVVDRMAQPGGRRHDRDHHRDATGVGGWSE